MYLKGRISSIVSQEPGCCIESKRKVRKEPVVYICLYH